MVNYYRRRINRRHRQRRNRRNARIDWVREYQPRRIQPVSLSTLFMGGSLADAWNTRSINWNPRPPRQSPPQRQTGPNRLNTPSRIPPGQHNQQRYDIYAQHVAAIRARQNQNPNWIGGRVRDPNLTQQSMEDFISRHGGPSGVDPRTGQRLRRDAAGRGVTNWNYLGDYGKH